MDNNVLTFLLLVIAIAFIVSGLFFIKGQKKLDKQKYRSKWMKIESSLKRDSEASYHLSILNADKLLDAALKESGYRGETMGQRLKNATGSFSNKNSVWAAHKLRNRIAHETDVRIDYTSARRALASIKQGLKDVGAI